MNKTRRRSDCWKTSCSYESSILMHLSRAELVAGSDGSEIGRISLAARHIDFNRSFGDVATDGDCRAGR